MEAETLTALLGSIQKWDCIAQGIGVNSGTANCPLCQLYFEQWGQCNGCPVAKAANNSNCAGTPYTRVDIGLNISVPYWISNRGYPKCVIDYTLDAVEAEVEFLVSLLPIGYEIEEYNEKRNKESITRQHSKMGFDCTRYRDRSERGELPFMYNVRK